MTSITFLGQGAMGSRMADRLEAAGHDVIRWNRSGAVQTPREAVADADIVIAMLRDDEASRSVWLDADTGALAGMKPGALAIESSTITRDHALALGEAVAAAGVRFLDAPVLGSRPQAEAGQLVHLIGGDRGDIAEVQPVLAATGGQAVARRPCRRRRVSQADRKYAVRNSGDRHGRTDRADEGRWPRPRNRHRPARGNTAAVACRAGCQRADAGGQGRSDVPGRTGRHGLFGYAIGGQPYSMPLASAALGVCEAAMVQGFADENLTAVRKLYQ